MNEKNKDEIIKEENEDQGNIEVHADNYKETTEDTSEKTESSVITETPKEAEQEKTSQIDEHSSNNESEINNEDNSENDKEEFLFSSQSLPRKHEPNKLLKGIGIGAFSLCFGLIGGFIGSGLVPNNGGDNILQQYKLESTSVTQTDAENLTDVSTIVDNTLPSIVSVTATIETEYYYGFGTQTYETPSQGSGVIYSQDKESLYIVTNYHVISDSKKIQIGWIDGTNSPAEIIGYSESDDIALLKVNLSDINDSTIERLKVAVIGDSDDCKVGKGVIAIGNALGYGQTVTSGIISALNRTVTFEDGNTMTMMQTNAAINPGNSGGALLNSKGELIGINSAKYTSTSVEGIGYAIPINTVQSVVEDILSGKTNQELESGVVLGITGYDITEQMSKAYNMPEGIFVQFVESDSAAEVSGLLPGDIILGVDGNTGITFSDLKEYLKDINVGETIKLDIERPSNNAYDKLTIEVIFN